MSVQSRSDAKSATNLRQARGMLGLRTEVTNPVLLKFMIAIERGEPIVSSLAITERSVLEGLKSRVGGHRNLGQRRPLGSMTSLPGSSLNCCDLGKLNGWGRLR